jgi:coenzyme A diphosphatase NUDT7
MENLRKELSAILAVDIENGGSYKEYFSAAVLVPIVCEKGQPSILFEVRSSHLSWQPGEVCFPGGHIEDGDKNSLFAAVRETKEELGLVSIEEIEVLGSIEEIISPIGVRLFPHVGYIPSAHLIAPNHDEVEEVFTVPLDFLLKCEPIISHMEMGTRPLTDFPFTLVGGYSEQWKVRKTYKVLFYQYGKYVIWGLTAQVLQLFLEKCKGMNSYRSEKR